MTTSMIRMRDDILANQITYYNGLIAKHKQNVEIYLANPVGIGEHPQHLEEVNKQIEKIANAKEKLEVLDEFEPAKGTQL